MTIFNGPKNNSKSRDVATLICSFKRFKHHLNRLSTFNQARASICGQFPLLKSLFQLSSFISFRENGGSFPHKKQAPLSARTRVRRARERRHAHFPRVTEIQTGARERSQSREENVRVFSLERVLLAFSPSAWYAG